MTNILHLSASPRGEVSLTRRLGAELLARLDHAHPEAIIIHRDLVADPLPHLTGPVVGAMFTPPDQRSALLDDAIKLSDQLVDELIAADLIVIESPMFNWSTPSALKAWIDHVVRIGRTFMPPSPDRAYRGLLKDRPVYIVVASGGVYTHGTRGNEDFLSPYLKHVLGFMGLRDLRYIHAEGVLSSSDAAMVSGREALSTVLVEADLAAFEAA